MSGHESEHNELRLTNVIDSHLAGRVMVEDLVHNLHLDIVIARTKRSQLKERENVLGKLLYELKRMGETILLDLDRKPVVVLSSWPSWRPYSRLPAASFRTPHSVPCPRPMNNPHAESSPCPSQGI